MAAPALRMLQETPSVRMRIGEMNLTLASLHDRVLGSIWSASDAAASMQRQQLQQSADGAATAARPDVATTPFL